MKTLHLTNSWGETSGGVAAFYRALIVEANRRGHEIRLIVPSDNTRVEQIGDFGRIYHIEAPRSPLNANYRTIYPMQFLVTGSWLQNILTTERPDLIEICDKYTLNYLGALIRNGLIPSLESRPVVAGLSQERMDDNVRAYLRSLPFAPALCAAYMKWVYLPFFDHHIANSEYTAAELRSAGEGHLVPRGVWIRPMGVDMDHLSPQRRNAEHRRRLLQNFGACDDAVLLLYVGRLVPEKNLNLLSDLVARLAKGGRRDYRLLVVGDGIQRKFWQSKYESALLGRAFFFGHIRDRNILADIYANADIFVHPNPREPFGIAPLEAMASGVPLVAPDTGGVTSFANGENAWIVPADVDHFTAAIEEVTANPALAAEKVKKALDTAQRYRWEQVTAAFLELYSELHRQELGQGTLQIPAFSSTPAGRWQAAIMRTAAVSAVRVFRLWALLASGNIQPRRHQHPRNIRSSHG